MTKVDDSGLDEALAIVDGSAPELANGFSNHAPMAVEALGCLGRADAVHPWLERYRAGFVPRPPRVRPIDPERWQADLGDLSRATDWYDFFRAELDRSTWPEVLDRWVGRLAPGIAAAAFHGPIRAGHAVRALGRAETPGRKRELAEGLAYWAADHQVLPASPRSPEPRRPLVALSSVARIPVEARGPVDSLTGALRELDGFPPFARVLGAVSVDDDAEAFLSDLTTTFAGVLVANARDFLTAITFVHGVTGPATLRPMLPHLSPETRRRALGHAWQAAAGLYARLGTTGELPGLNTRSERSADEIVAWAVASADEHAIKITAACLAEHDLRPAPVWLAAAERAVGLLEAGT